MSLYLTCEICEHEGKNPTFASDKDLKTHIQVIHGVTFHPRDSIKLT